MVQLPGTLKNGVVPDKAADGGGMTTGSRPPPPVAGIGVMVARVDTMYIKSVNLMADIIVGCGLWVVGCGLWVAFEELLGFSLVSNARRDRKSFSRSDPF